MTLFALDNDIDNFNNILSSNFALKINHDRNEHLQLGMYLSSNPAFCKRLPSHTGQGQACSRITRLFVRLFVTMPKMAQYTGKWLLPAP